MGMVIIAIAIFILLVAYIGVSFILNELWIESRPTMRALDLPSAASSQNESDETASQ